MVLKSRQLIAASCCENWVALREISVIVALQTCRRILQRYATIFRRTFSFHQIPIPSDSRIVPAVSVLEQADLQNFLEKTV
jgi:hypothetical protein